MRPARPKKRGIAGIVSTYGWRVYAVPILVALTVLVLIKVTGPGPDNSPDQTAADASTAQGGTPSTPQATEEPPTPVNDAKVPTAELPKGGPYAQSGSATWRVLPGTTKRVGTGGRLYTYSVEVENGIDPAMYGDDSDFSKLVDQTLADPRGWTGTGDVSVQRVDPNVTRPDIRISLSTPNTVHRADYCGYSIHYESSCWRSSKGRVMINLARWVRGAIAFNGDMLTYHQYALNHEIGHAFGNHHVGCQKDGGLAPVMMQQTFGVANDYVAKLNQVDPTNRDAVPSDHKVCKPNAWPKPQVN
ncbi:uncharacterized protein DUF3152 [Labedaea rhizosphaerae]|uniref:Uncharacterized protein DUF3152 n=1 Tax=Labedaea rhizosphaerae TaxID=598644 RepID=A0A4R6S572_LABRH|nr:uncharacterized protein DUF3152 [Labedaea rhizosphaerae]